MMLATPFKLLAAEKFILASVTSVPSIVICIEPVVMLVKLVSACWVAESAPQCDEPLVAVSAQRPI